VAIVVRRGKRQVSLMSSAIALRERADALRVLSDLGKAFARRGSLWSATIALLAMTLACSKHDPPSTPHTSANTTTAKTTPRIACEMLPAAEMSAILGSSVTAEGDKGGGSTTCRYQRVGGTFPFVELTIDWGAGAVAMSGFGLLARHEPGMVDPLAGLGDQATAIGPAVMVRLGDDLLNLTLTGVEDHVGVAHRVVAALRPRMGPSAQAKNGDVGEDQQGEQAKAAQLVTGLLNGIVAANGRASAAGTNSGASKHDTAPVADSEPLRPASGAAVRVPLVAGLTLVGAEHEPQRGDYEPIVTIASVTDRAVATTFSANLPEGGRMRVDRDVRRDDLRQARAYSSWYVAGDPKVFPGATSFGVSADVYRDLTMKGRAQFDRLASDDASGLAALVQLAGGGSKSGPSRHRGMLERVEPHALALPMLVNDAAVELPVLHARGVFDDATIDYYILDDAANPLLLRVAGGSVGRIVRIAYPQPSVAPIEETLRKDSRVALHGIYFDFGKATIRPESDAVLSDVATALTHNPAWSVVIEGHTDVVGDETSNLDLSRRRAEAVKEALVQRHHIAAERLTTAGFGASRPSAPNDTLSGRARNRRVELVRR
jgi:outer membrane protein OmpA-like peptidoglycan-associated protein